MKYELILREEGNYRITDMCRWAKVSRSGYSNWRDRGPSATELWRRDLASVIAFLFEQSDGTYGYRRIHADLLRRGHHCDDETVRVIMRELDLVPCQPKPFRPTTTIAGDTSATADLVMRDFTAQAPARKLVSDITYVRTWEGWLYLVVVLDCFTKQVVGYAMADHMRTELILQAMGMAHSRGAFIPGITIFHSDRGCQYTSQEFADAAKYYGLRRSLGRTGTCYDNAWAESWNGTLKNERVNRTVYATREQARLDITDYIELRYNHIRLHSSLGYRTPNEVKAEWIQQNPAA